MRNDEKGNRNKPFLQQKRWCLCRSKRLLQRHPDALNCINPKSGFQSSFPRDCVYMEGQMAHRKGEPPPIPTELLPGWRSGLVRLPPNFFKKYQLQIASVKSPYFKMLATSSVCLCCYYNAVQAKQGICGRIWSALELSL